MPRIMRDHRFFEQWARKNSMRPICRVEEPGGDVLLADSGRPFYTTGEDGRRRFVYRTAFAIEREQCWVASVADTDATDPEMMSRTPQGAQEFRVNEALAYARNAIAQTSAAGLYDRGQASIY